MEDIEKSELSPVPRFLTQWNAEKRPSWALVTTEPTCTIPDQSMTIQEIIQKFTRTGLVPQSYLRRDEGGNVAADPDSDPLDEWNEVHDSAAAEAAAAGSSEPAQAVPAPGEPEPTAQAGNGGE